MRPNIIRKPLPQKKSLRVIVAGELYRGRNKNPVAGSAQSVEVSTDSFLVVDGGQRVPVALVVVLVAEGCEGLWREIDLEG